MENKALSELARTALLGTDRANVPVPAADSPLLAVTQQLADLPSEYQILGLAGVASLYSDAGRLPRQHLAPSQPSDQQSLSNSVSRGYAACPAAASQILSKIIEGPHRLLMPELLRALGQAHLTVPREMIPNVLSYGTNQYALRDVVLNVIGPQGRTLGDQNPKWIYASPSFTEWKRLVETWSDTSSATARQSLLRHARAADPALGLRMLEISWKSESPTNRLMLIRGLEHQLSMIDEPFLESALDDRNHSVRKKAAELLTYLPGSRLCQRMTLDSRSLLTWQPEHQSQIAVCFPDELSEQMQRDGVLHAATSDESRLRRSWLLAVMSAVPLDEWTERWHATAQDIVRAVCASRWPRTLLQGLIQATERQKHQAWANALLDVTEFKAPMTKVISLLSADEFDALLTRIDREGSEEQMLDKHHPLLIVMRRWPHRWTATAVHLWLDKIGVQSTQESEKSSIDSLVRTATKQFARQCPHSLIDHSLATILTMADSCAPPWRATLEESEKTLQMRRSMFNALSINHNTSTETKDERK